MTLYARQADFGVYVYIRLLQATPFSECECLGGWAGGRSVCREAGQHRTAQRSVIRGVGLQARLDFT